MKIGLAVELEDIQRDLYIKEYCVTIFAELFTQVFVMKTRSVNTARTTKTGPDHEPVNEIHILETPLSFHG